MANGFANEMAKISFSLWKFLANGLLQQNSPAITIMRWLGALRSSSSSSLSTSESCCLNISWLDEALLESLLACKELRGMAAGQRRLLQAGTSGQEDPRTSTSRSTSTLPWKAWEETEERFNPDGQMWQQKHRRKRVQHLSPRDLKKVPRVQ